MRRKGEGALTADGRRLLEDLGDLRVHLDHEVVLHGHLGVAGLDLLLDPLGEWLADHRGDDVADPLLRRLGQLNLLLRQILEDMRVVVGHEPHDLLDAEAFIPD